MVMFNAVFMLNNSGHLFFYETAEQISIFVGVTCDSTHGLAFQC